MSYSTVKSWCSSENNSFIQSFLASTSVSLSIDTYVGNFLKKVYIYVMHVDNLRNTNKKRLIV